MKNNYLLSPCLVLRSFRNDLLQIRPILMIIITTVFMPLTLAKAENVKQVVEIGQLQRKQISGLIKDVNNSPIVGANVIEKNVQSNGTVTDLDGRFTLNVEDNATVLISYIGYLPQEIIVNKKTYFEIVLQEDAQTLDEIVVVGYATQKKANLTGAVDQIGREFFEDRPIPNLSRGLQGAIPNLNIKMTDGKPLRNPAFNVRGVGSIGAGGSALILIDGVEGDPQNLNPNDIESISVLKDASSASIYGARGTFGVVLITTKNPIKGKVQFNYSGNYSINKRTTEPDWITDGYIWAKMFNESWSSWYDYANTPKTVGNFFPFSQDYLAELKRRHDNPGDYSEVEIDPATGKYIYYGNTDWQKLLYKESMPTTEHTFSASGGNERTDFIVSGRYFHQDGIFRYNTDKFNSFNLRLKGGVNVTNWLRISANTDYTNLNYRYPLSSINKYDIWTNLKIQGFPIAVMFNPDGTLTRSAANSVGEFYYGKSNSIRIQNQIRTTLGFESSFFEKKLSVKGDFSHSSYNREIQNKIVPVSYSEKPGQTTTQGTNSLRYNTVKTNYLAANLYATYNISLLQNHNFKFLAGVNVESSSRKDKDIQRYDLLVDDLDDFNLTVGEGYRITGGGNEWSTIGYFGRLNYDYKNKYLLELNGRYDGSSKFPLHQAYGFFPSVSFGWNVAEESFMGFSNSWLDLLKLRTSYGSLGNGAIASYQFIQSLGVARSSIILNNGNYVTYIKQPSVVPNNLTWETVTTLNFGLDVNLLKNRLVSTFDIFQRKTTDMITTGQPLPAVFGASVPKGNFADLTTKGFEISLAWRDQIKTSYEPITYGVRFTLADSKAIIDKFYNPTNLITSNYVGRVYGEIWGYEAEGLFLSEEDITNHADQSFIKVSSGNILMPGDLKFRDLNKDNKIDRGKSTLEDHGDLKIIGNSEARYTYSVTGNVSWNSISISAFFQGVGKRNWWPGHESGIFWGQYTRWYGQIPRHTLEGTWTVDNPNPNSYFPRYRGPLTSYGRELDYPIDRYLQDVSYIRLKDLQVAYDLPQKIVKKSGLTNMKIYISGQNLWTYSPMYKITKDIDPEVIEGSDPEIRSDMGDGASYPMLKTMTIGINISF